MGQDIPPTHNRQLLNPESGNRGLFYQPFICVIDHFYDVAHDLIIIHIRLIKDCAFQIFTCIHANSMPYLCFTRLAFFTLLNKI